jgi:hypothetical protein
MTTINLRTSVVIPTLEGDQATLPEDVRTLRELLHYIGGKINFDIIDSLTGNLHDDFEIGINGKDVLFLPSGIDTHHENKDTG